MTLFDDLTQRRPYNAVVDFIDVNISRGLSGKIAFIDPARSISYSQLQADTCRFARSLAALGLRQESRIILLLLDSVEFPIAFWGAIRAGIIPIPLNSLLTTEQYAYVFEDSRAEALVISGSLLKTVETVVGQTRYLRNVIVIAPHGKTESVYAKVPTHGFNEILSRASAEPFVAPTVSDEVAFWLYSSGSTGDPKGVKHIHTSLIATACGMGQGVLGIAVDDVVFSAAKLFFAYGLGNAMSFPMSVGASAVLLPDRPTPDLVFALMRRYRPTMLFAGPALYAALLRHKDIAPGFGSDRLRLCVSAGDALPASLGERWRSVVGMDILDGIGSTEMLNTFISNRPGDVRYGTSGMPVPGYEAKIVDEDGRELGSGNVGELVVRGPSAADGYWNQRAKSRRTFVGEWVHTSDTYVRDFDGYYQYCGRMDDMFKVGGVWISPSVIEAAFTSHEAVLAAAAIGSKDSDGFIKPKAFVVLNDRNQPDAALLLALKAHVKSKLVARFSEASQGFYAYYPRWIEFRRELPMTATGKVQRFRLREDDVVKST
jgi:4-hydroxybenzoate-CoA ligase